MNLSVSLSLSLDYSIWTFVSVRLYNFFCGISLRFLFGKRVRREAEEMLQFLQLVCYFVILCRTPS